VTTNPHIAHPLKRLIKAHSKRLRPMFVIAVAASQGVKIDKTVIQACAAIELAHIGTLVHDDIIDQAAIRWRVPTINSQEGSDQAILIGDYLFAKAFEQAAMVSQQVATMIGSALADLCDGQSMEMADQYNLGRTEKSLQRAHKGKTASLFELACQVGGMCAQLQPSQVSALASYGENFGMTFQLIDDLLNILSTDEIFGKPVGNDASEGVYTLPIIYSLKGQSAKNLKSILAKKNKIDQAKLVDMLLRDGSIGKTIQKSKSYNRLASEALDKLSASTAITDLKNLPEIYLTQALKHYVAPQHRVTVNSFLASTTTI